MNKYINSVGEFHEIFGHPINNYKDEISLQTRELRIKLLFEELQELATASDVKETFFLLCNEVVSAEHGAADEPSDYSINGDNVDKKEELDALCDIQYVLSGAILALGHHNNFDEAFDEVHSSNMSKMCNSLSEVEDTINFYKNKDVEGYAIQKGDRWIVLRVGDDKVLKNFHYTEAQLEKFVK